MDRGRITLDNAIFQDRLRKPEPRTGYVRRPTPKPVRRMDDVYQPQVKRVEKKKDSFIYEPDLPAPKTPEKPVEVQAPASVLPQTSPRIVPQKSQTKRRLPLKRPALPGYSLNKPYAVVLVVSILLAGGVYVGLRSPDRQDPDNQVVAAYSTQSSNDQAPTESQIAGYSVAPDLPRYIDISFIGVQARIFQVAGQPDGSLAQPPSIFDAGWYSASAKPGGSPAMLITGHIGDGNAKGIFYNLNQVVKGNEISITRGDGKVFNYQVVKTEMVKTGSVKASGLLSSQDSAKAGLNLITSAGDTLPGTNRTDEQIVVYSVLE